MKCEQLKEALATGPRSAEAVLEHLAECEECRSQWASAGMLSESDCGPLENAESCTRTDALLAWWDGSLSPDETAQLMAHVSKCSPCLAELTRISRDIERVEIAETVEPPQVPTDLEQQAIALGAQLGAAPVPNVGAHGARTRRRTWLLLPAAAGVVFVALGLGLLLVDRDPFGSERGNDFVARSGPQAASSDLELLAPLDGPHVKSELRFSWTAAGSATSPERRYRLIVLDVERGTTLIDVVTDRTEYTPLASERDRLLADTRYHWIVEPLGPGAGDPSEAGGFTVTP